jgi:ribosomal protein L11 methyltransferase
MTNGQRMLICRVRSDQSDALLGRLAVAGASGFELRDRQVDAAIPSGEVEVLTYGSPELIDSLAACASQFSVLLAPPVRAAVEAVDWAEAWKVHFEPIRVSPRLAVVPSWHDDEPEDGVIALRIDPGAAFGTGQHATTILVLRALDQLAAEAPIGDFADIGCGTGILALAARRLGAGALWLVENDRLALDIARSNLAIARVDEPLRFELLDRPRTARRFDTVVANILAPVLIELAPDLDRLVAPGGQLLLSGLLTNQIDEVIHEFLLLGRTIFRSSSEGEWALLWLR